MVPARPAVCASSGAGRSQPPCEVRLRGSAAAATRCRRDRDPAMHVRCLIAVTMHTEGQPKVGQGRAKQVSCPVTPDALALYDDLIKGLVARRRSLGLSQNALDDRIGCADGLISKWECGMRRPSAWNLACWMAALDCEVSIAAAQTVQVQDRNLKTTGR
jgi:hypothetical protein